VSSFVVGTAGHIDHGKTALVRALTGVDTDRLAVEKARGITTELGFAKLALGDRVIAMVDVPGHERFVKSMVAGATGIDVVLLVIGADEGVMPQTREHVDICDLLGVRRGIVVLTKSDLVDAEWLELVTTEIRGELAGTFLERAPFVAVSAKTGAGLDELRSELSRAIDSLPARSAAGAFRLPIDRVFTLKGFGTIVTGTIADGTVAVGDELVTIGSELATRVRSIEVHGAAVQRASAGQRAAINLGGIAVDQLDRGDMLAHPGAIAASHILDVELRYLRGAPGPLPSRSKVLLHHGTAQVMATLRLASAEPLPPGAATIAQLRVDRETPLGAAPDDRFIVRGFVASATSGTTIGGGRIVRVLAPKLRDPAEHAARVTALADAKLERQIALLVETSAAAGLAETEIARRVARPLEQLAAPLATLVAAGELLAIGGHYLHAAAVVALEAAIVEKVAAAGDDGALREALRTQLPAALPARAFDPIVLGLERKGGVAPDGDRLRRAAKPSGPMLSPLDAELLARFTTWALEPPRPKELAGAIGRGEAETKTALDRLLAGKLVVRIKPDLMMSAKVVADVRDRLLAFLAANRTIDAQQWKELTGASRKFTIPLAEYFDAEKLTLRVGDVRRKR